MREIKADDDMIIRATYEFSQNTKKLHDILK